MNVHVGRRDRVAALRGHQRPVRAHLVVAPAEHFERFPRLAGAGVELPVHLLALQRLVEALQQPELGRRAVPDAYMGVVAVDVPAKRPREEVTRNGHFASGPCSRSASPRAASSGPSPDSST